MKQVYIILLALCLSGVAANAQTETYSRVSIALQPDTYARLQALGLAVDHADLRGNLLVAELSASELQLMQSQGISYQTEIPDLERFYAQRAAQDRAATTRQMQNTCATANPADTVTVPASFTLGSMGGFFTYAEMLAHLDNMAALYPTLITVKQPIAGHLTIEGRPIYWVKISDNPDLDESASEPQVLYDAVHHAREPMSMSQTIFYMYYLLENYTASAAIKDLVDNMELFFVPCVNPDGYLFNQNNSPNGGGMWRKNRRNNGNGTMGVDLNRNYGFNWGYDNLGSSPNSNTETYRGTAPFSEPETQAMKAFCEAHQFRNAYNAHSFSNVLIYPYGHAPDVYTPDSARYVEWAELLTQDNNYGYGTVPQVLGYFGNGDADAWMYGEQTTKPKIFAFTPEVGASSDGFWPQPSRIIPLAQGMLTSNLHLAMLARRIIKAEGAPGALVNSLSPVLDFNLRSLGLEAAGPVTVTLQSASPYVQSAGAPLLFASLPDLVPVPASIGYTLSSATPQNTVVPLQVVVSQGANTWTYHFAHTYFTGTPLVANDFSSTQGLTGSWGLSTTVYRSPGTSITDSPLGSYAANSLNIMNIDQPIDLTTATTAFIRFWARWDIESGWDYAQVRAVTPTGTAALCGRYTRPGAGAFQPAGQPLYDGRQTEWVEEVMSLDDFLGQQIKLQFLLASDSFVEQDGIYIDDLEVFVLNPTGLHDSPHSAGFMLGNCYPNPASGVSSVAYRLPQGSGAADLVLTDMAGRVAARYSLAQEQGMVQVDTRPLPAGVYGYYLQTGSRKTAAKRMAVTR